MDSLPVAQRFSPKIIRINTYFMKLECWFSGRQNMLWPLYHVFAVGTDIVCTGRIGNTLLLMHFHSKMLSYYVHELIMYTISALEAASISLTKVFRARKDSSFSSASKGIWRALVPACVFANLLSHLSSVNLISHSFIWSYELKVAGVGLVSQVFSALP